MKRLLALLLCLAALLSLSATALADDYSFISDTEDKLLFPSANSYYEAPFPATVKAVRESASIYIMPQPEAGHGELGTLPHGTEVTVLAEQGGFFFFETADGWFGWNGKVWFDFDAQAARGERVTRLFPVESDEETLVLPQEEDFVRKPFVRFVSSGNGDGAIYLMPQPEAGHGEIGRVRDGKAVLILAQRGGFYFFRTEYGEYGWNGTGWFYE